MSTRCTLPHTSHSHSLTLEQLKELRECPISKTRVYLCDCARMKRSHLMTVASETGQAEGLQISSQDKQKSHPCPNLPLNRKMIQLTDSMFICDIQPNQITLSNHNHFTRVLYCSHSLHCTLHVPHSAECHRVAECTLHS